MIGFVIDPNSDTAKLAEVNGLEDYYRTIGCDCIDISMVYLNNRLFNVVCDDEGLLKGGAVPSVFDGDGNPIIVNTVIVLGADEESCDTRSLTLDEALMLANAMYDVHNNFGGRWSALVVD